MHLYLALLQDMTLIPYLCNFRPNRQFLKSVPVLQCKNVREVILILMFSVNFCPFKYAILHEAWDIRCCAIKIFINALHTGTETNFTMILSYTCER
jgi:hypothetical protein